MACPIIINSPRITRYLPAATDRGHSATVTDHTITVFWMDNALVCLSPLFHIFLNCVCLLFASAHPESSAKVGIEITPLCYFATDQKYEPPALVSMCCCDRILRTPIYQKWLKLCRPQATMSKEKHYFKIELVLFKHGGNSWLRPFVVSHIGLLLICRGSQELSSGNISALLRFMIHICLSIAFLQSITVWIHIRLLAFHD